jgi:D-sedoheptulose 7-phosphate isomerase
MQIKKNQFNIILNKSIEDSIKVTKSIKKEKEKIFLFINKINEILNKNGKLLICGNGGSAADSHHIATELLVRFKPKNNRRSIPIIPLDIGTATVTACGNDLGFNNLFARNLSSLGNKNDMLIVMTTSGKSKNILNVLKLAKKMNIFSFGLLGNKGGEAIKLCDLSLLVQSTDTARIQEAHKFIGHIVCEIVEKKFL